MTLQVFDKIISDRGSRYAVSGGPARNRAEAEQAARDIGGDAFGFAADVSDPASTVAMAEFCLKQTGRIDILAANAGIFPAAPLATMTAEQFDHVMHTNMRGTFLSVKSCMPAMTAQKWKKRSRQPASGTCGGKACSRCRAANCSAPFWRSCWRRTRS